MWTKNKVPKKEGWYWIKFFRRTEGERYEIKAPALVTWFGEKYVVRCSEGMNFNSNVVDLMGDFWFGKRIPFPRK